MKPHKILKTFQGNQTGNGPTERFAEGTTAPLSRDLAAIAVKEGWAEPIDAPAPKPTQVIEPNEIVHGPAEDREMKVTEPEETKPEKPSAKKGKKAA